MAMLVMHRLAMKFGAVFGCSLASAGHGSVVTLAIIELMIDVSVEMFRPAVPRSRPDEYTA